MQMVGCIILKFPFCLSPFAGSLTFLGNPFQVLYTAGVTASEQREAHDVPLVAILPLLSSVSVAASWSLGQRQSQAACEQGGLPPPPRVFIGFQ